MHSDNNVFYIKLTLNNTVPKKKKELDLLWCWIGLVPAMSTFLFG